MCSEKVHDCTVFHPLGNHHQGVGRFGGAYQRQQVRVFELFPLHHLATETLSRSRQNVGGFRTIERKASRRSHPFHADKVNPGVDPQHLDGDLETSVDSTPYVRVSTSPIWDFSNPPQLVGYSVRGWQQPVFATHLPKHHRKPFLMVGTQARVLPRALFHVS